MLKEGRRGRRERSRIGSRSSRGWMMSLMDPGFREMMLGGRSPRLILRRRTERSSSMLLLLSPLLLLLLSLMIVVVVMMMKMLWRCVESVDSTLVVMLLYVRVHSQMLLLHFNVVFSAIRIRFMAVSRIGDRTTILVLPVFSIVAAVTIVVRVIGLVVC